MVVFSSKLFKLIFLSVFVSLVTYGQNEPVKKPVKDDSFLAFRTKLESCVAEKDKEALKGLLYDRIRECWDAFDCAGASGCPKEEFIEVFFRDEKSPHWDMLSNLLKHGFYKANDTIRYEHISHHRDRIVYISPAYLKDFNEDGDLVMVLVESLNLRYGPSKNSKVIKKIPYGPYKYLEDDMGYPEIYYSDDDMEWIKLILTDGIQGYVARKHTSEHINRRLRVARIEGQWKIIEYYCEMNI